MLFNLEHNMPTTRRDKAFPVDDAALTPPKTDGGLFDLGAALGTGK